MAAVGDPRFNRFQDQSGSSQISIAGGPVRTNNYLLDGVPITDFNNRAVIIPSLEATQEEKVQINTYDAEIARTGGGVFNTVLKSGTNALHGTLYGETRQTNWAAHPYFYTPGAPFSATYYTYAGAIGGAGRDSAPVQRQGQDLLPYHGRRVSAAFAIERAILHPDRARAPGEFFADVWCGLARRNERLARP